MAELEGRVYEPLTQRGARLHAIRQTKAMFVELRERLELAGETWTHAREEGADLVTAGLAALRVAAQRHGLKREQRLDESGEHVPGHVVEAKSIQDRLEKILGRDLQANEIAQEAETDAIRNRLSQVLGHDKHKPREKQQYELDDERKRQRQLERERLRELDIGLDWEL